MEGKSHRFIACALAVIAIQGIARSQDSARVVILSRRVGPVIGVEDRERFHLLNAIKDFVRATVYQAPDSSFYVRVASRAPGDTMTERRVPFSLSGLLMMAEKINHFEELERGTYRMGTDRPRLLYADGNEAVVKKAWVELAAGKGWENEREWLPSISPNAREPEYPSFGLGLGFSSSAGDLGVVSELTRSIESFYRSSGYSISSVDPNMDLNPLLCMVLSCRITPSWALGLEAGTTMGGGEVSLRTASFSAYYYPVWRLFGALQPVVGGGVDAMRISLDQVLVHGNRISVVDQSNGYYSLDNIIIGGSHTAAGYHLTGGLEILMNKIQSPAVRLTATYYSRRGHAVVAYENDGNDELLQGRVTTGGVTFGILLMVNL